MKVADFRDQIDAVYQWNTSVVSDPQCSDCHILAKVVRELIVMRCKTAKERDIERRNNAILTAFVSLSTHPDALKLIDLVAWTGGSVPDKIEKKMPVFRALRRLLYREQVTFSGGLGFWACAGTSVLERARVFWNRASYDAHATIREVQRTPTK